MSHIIKTSSEGQPGIAREESINPFVGKDPSQDKVESLSRSYFESRNKHTNNTLLISGIKAKQVKNDNNFDFRNEINEINKDSLIKDKDQALASRFNKFVNPGNIPDGHCASCAFNTHLHFIGQKLEEAIPPDNSKEFGDWFYLKFSPRFEENIVESNENETYGAMKDRVEQRVKELTKPYEAVLISISDGVHWFNAYNDGKKIWFIDSQTGKGFNLYENKEKQPEEIISKSQTINIVRVEIDDISECQQLTAQGSRLVTDCFQSSHRAD